MSETSEAVDTMETVEDRLRETADWSRMPDIDGAAAWNALHQYQAILIEATWPIEDDASYEIGGFHSYAHFKKVMADHAMDEANRLYDVALEKLGEDVDSPSFVPTVKTMDQLPYLDLKAALEWIKKSGYPLLADATYEEIGSTRADFFEETQIAHITAARFKIGNAATWEGDPETGMALVESALRDNLAAVGLSANSPELMDNIAIDSAAVRAIHGNHAMRKFKAQMAEIAGWRQFKKTDAPEYHEAILKAAITLGRSEALNEAAEVYNGTGFTRDSFEAEGHRCAEHKLARLVSEITAGEISGTFLEEKIQEIKALRDLFSFVKAPDDTPLDFIEEDYWCGAILQQFGFRSYTHLVEQLTILSARTIINNTLFDSKAEPLERHDDLSEAVALLKDARYPVNDTAALDAIEIDREALTRSFVAATYPAAMRDWSLIRSDTLETASKLNVISMLRDAQSRLREAGAEDKLPFTSEALDAAEDQIMLRRAEEIIADFMIAMDTPNGFEILRGAYQIFDDLEADLLNAKVHGPMGMDAKFAEYIDDRFGMMEMADVWIDATDEELSLTQRFEAATSFAKQMETLDDEQVSRLTRHLGLDRPPASGVLIEKLAKSLYAEMMGFYDEYGSDPVKGYEYLNIAAECLKTLHPKALESDIHFFKVTGRNSRSAFLADLERCRRQTEAITKPMAVIFSEATGVLEDLKEALKPENKGRKAYDMVEVVARTIRQDGRSILDPSILTPLNMTPADLVNFLDEQALIVAREHADTARNSKGFPITLATIQDHPYQHFRHALSCLSRHSQGTVLDDEQWQKMGFASRTDFMDQFREALLDATSQMEKLAETPKAMAEGPFGFLRLLNEIRRSNRALGIETRDDIPDFAETGNTTSHGGAIETTQRAINRMAHAACLQVLREDVPPSVKFKKIRFIYNFAEEMRTTEWAAGGKVKELNAAYKTLVQQRVENAVNAFNKRNSDPGRGVRLALALKDVAARYQLREEPWFQYLFMGMNYRDFDAFCDYAALQRMRQIVERTKKAMIGLKGDDQLNPTAHLFMMRDMIRIENLAGEDGLLSERRRDDILDELGVDPEWHRLQMAVSAQFAIPQMLREADDPTLEDTERWAIIDEALDVLKLIGRARTGKIEIDKPALGRQRTRTVLRMTALNLVEDMLRIETDTVSMHMVNAANVLGLLKTYFHDEPAAQKMGLKPDEIIRLIEQERLLPAYTLARNLYEVSADDVTGQLVVIMNLYDAFGASELDPHNPKHLQKIGLKKPLDFMAKLDAMTLKVLATACSDLPKIEHKPASKVESLNLILRFTEITNIESRASKEDLKQLGILTHAEIVKALTIAAPKAEKAKQTPPRKGGAAEARPAMA